MCSSLYDSSVHNPVTVTVKFTKWVILCRMNAKFNKKVASSAMAWSSWRTTAENRLSATIFKDGSEFCAGLNLDPRFCLCFGFAPPPSWLFFFVALWCSKIRDSIEKNFVWCMNQHVRTFFLLLLFSTNKTFDFKRELASGGDVLATAGYLLWRQLEIYELNKF